MNTMCIFLLEQTSMQSKDSHKSDSKEKWIQKLKKPTKCRKND